MDWPNPRRAIEKRVVGCEIFPRGKFLDETKRNKVIRWFLDRPPFKVGPFHSIGRAVAESGSRSKAVSIFEQRFQKKVKKKRRKSGTRPERRRASTLRPFPSVALEIINQCRWKRNDEWTTKNGVKRGADFAIIPILFLGYFQVFFFISNF